MGIRHARQVEAGPNASEGEIAMWVMFAAGCIVLYCALLVPGFLAARGLLLPRFESILIAPLLTVFVFEVVATALVYFGGFCSFASVFLPSMAICGLVYAASRGIQGPHWNKGSLTKFQRTAIILYSVIGVVLGCWLVLRVIQSPITFAQSWDNASHINSVEAFAESGSYRLIGSSSYVVDGEMVVRGGFYPTAFHTLAAMLVNLFSLPATAAINCANFVFSCIVYPLGCLLLLSKLFKGNRETIIAGGFICLSLLAFPWRLFYWGPIYPNLMAFCMLPLAGWVFLDLLSPHDRVGKLGADIVLAIAGLVALAISHPNSVFALGVLLASFISVRIYQEGSESGSSIRGVILAAFFLIAAAILWIVIWRSPFMAGVVAMVWPSFDTKAQAIIDIATLALPGTGDPNSAAQLIVAIFAVAGVVALVKDRANRWLLWSFAATVVIYFACVSLNGGVKSLLSGFWYQDQSRTAALVAIAAMPIVSCGLGAVLKFIVSRFALSRITGGRAAAIAFTLAFCALNFMPNFSISGMGQVDTAFGGMERSLFDSYNLTSRNQLDDGEIEFLRLAESEIPPDAIVLNQVCDGSVYSYGVTGTHVAYRGFGEFVWPSDVNDPVFLIRGHLDEIEDRADVRNAVAQIGATYFLQLDADGGNEKTMMYHADNFPPNLTTGMDDIDSSTPGFELVMQKDDMRLYKITALEDQSK